ncbi:MAG: hypothetical protein U1E53_05590 [Dongiaceae bacterium]
MMRRAGIRSTTLLSLFLALAAGVPAKAAPQSEPRSTCPRNLADGIPPRPPGALAGSAFARQVEGLDESAREKAIVAELLAGNIPDFLRTLKPVRLQGTLPSGRIVTVVLCVTPDYLAIGSDADFLRIPVRLSTALRVAQRFGFVLPTPRIVDAVYDQADARLAPQPLPPTDEMRSTAYYRTHNGLVGGQLQEREVAPGALVAGDKKDLVLTNELRTLPDRVAIYGWHTASGHPIQPLNLWHGARYADYSHGARLVSQIVLVNDMIRSLYDVMSDPKLSPIVSAEGPIPLPRQLVAELSVPPAEATAVAAAAAPMPATVAPAQPAKAVAAAPAKKPAQPATTLAAAPKKGTKAVAAVSKKPAKAVVAAAPKKKPAPAIAAVPPKPAPAKPVAMLPPPAAAATPGQQAALPGSHPAAIPELR